MGVPRLQLEPSSRILDNIPIQMLGGMQLPYRLYKLHDQNPLTLPYMESQEKAFCLVHATWP